MEEEVLEQFECNPTINVRTVSDEIRIPKSTISFYQEIQCIHITYNEFKAFCCRVWSLLLQFCQLIVNKIDENPSFCENIVFIDEAGFDRNRIISTITIFINGLQKIPK